MSLDLGDEHTHGFNPPFDETKQKSRALEYIKAEIHLAGTVGRGESLLYDALWVLQVGGEITSGLVSEGQDGAFCLHLCSDFQWSAEEWNKILLEATELVRPDASLLSINIATACVSTILDTRPTCEPAGLGANSGLVLAPIAYQGLQIFDLKFCRPVCLRHVGAIDWEIKRGMRRWSKTFEAVDYLSLFLGDESREHFIHEMALSPTSAVVADGISVRARRGPS